MEWRKKCNVDSISKLQVYSKLTQFSKLRFNLCSFRWNLKKNILAHFYKWGSPSSRLQSHYKETVSLLSTTKSPGIPGTISNLEPCSRFESRTPGLYHFKQIISEYYKIKLNRAYSIQEWSKRRMNIWRF